MNFNRSRDPDVIILQGDVNRLIEVAQAAGKELAQQNLTTSQIRNIFGEVRAVEAAWRTDPEGSHRRMALLEPKLAYAAARSGGGRGKNPVQSLSSILSPCLEVVRQAEPNQRKIYFDRFVDFFEAILAYHREAGGRTN